MKKLSAVISVIIACFLILVGCSEKKPFNSDSENKNKKIIYTTFFPVTDLTKKIAGDKWEVKTIIQGSQEPHSFELKIDDVKDIKLADLIIYNGANMESFIPDLEKSIDSKDKFLDLSQGLTLLNNEGHEENNKDSVNPHTWLSVKNAMIQLDTIYRKLSSIDSENESYYKANLDKYLEELSKIDKKFEEEIAKIQKEDKYFVVSHAAFNYLADDYGLKQIAVTGISPEDEPSAKQLKDIADFVKKHNISTIFFEGKSTPKVAETLANNTNTKTDTLYTMESLTEEEIAMGYLKLMELNLEALVKSFE